MRVLVTGAGGLIGSEVVGQLLDRSHDVVALDRPGSMARLSRWQGKIDHPGRRSRRRRRDARRLTESRPDAIIHMAWYADPKDYLRRLGTSHRSRRRHASSSGARIRLPQAGDRRVVRRIRAARSTARRRRSGGPCDALRRLQASGVDRVARPCRRRRCRAVLGANFSPAWPARRPARLIPWVARELRAGRVVDLTDGTQVRDHLHVVDVAAGLVRLLVPGASGIYNVCSGQPVTLRQVLETVGEIVGGTALLRFGARPHRPGETMFLAGDPGRLRALGWSPRFGLEDGLRDALLGGN